MTSLEFPEFLNLLKEQMWYQPATGAVNVPLEKGAVPVVPAASRYTFRLVEKLLRV